MVTPQSFQHGREAVDRLGDDVAVQGHVVHVVLGDHVLHELVGGMRVKGFWNPAKVSESRAPGLVCVVISQSFVSGFCVLVV